MSFGLQPRAERGNVSPSCPRGGLVPATPRRPSAVVVAETHAGLLLRGEFTASPAWCLRHAADVLASLAGRSPGLVVRVEIDGQFFATFEPARGPRSRDGE